MTLSCYHCKSQPGDNRNCDEPSLSRIESNKRSCPADEKCVKIEQVSGDRKSRSIIRDCYKTLQMTDGYYTSIDYYGERLEGNVYFCEKNYCNSQSRLRSIAFVNIIIILIAFVAGRF
jgi:hypothetical protein